MRRLTPADDGVSGTTTVPKQWLQIDGLVNDNGAVEGVPVMWNRKGRGRYELVILDDDLTPLDEPAVADGGHEQ